MGGLNQIRYGTAASFDSLPEYQYPSKAHSQANNHQRRMCAAPAQHVQPGASPSSFPDAAATAALKERVMMGSPVPSIAESQTGMSDARTNSGGSNSSTASSYQYNPYDTECVRQTVSISPRQALYEQQMQHREVNPYQEYEYPASQEEEESLGMQGQQQLPFGTLHSQLEPYVTFIPYPTEEFVNPNKSRCHAPSEGTMSRVFLGQLPYQVTDMQLDWLCYTFGNGGAVHFPERITKHDPMRGCKMPTGCIHAYVENHHAAAMLNALHKHILVDDTGVWFAENADQQAVLNDYCLMMKNDKTKRYQNRPYDTVVAQFATSSYVRRR